MKRTPRWISKSAVLAIHESLLAEHGGRTGQPDEAGPESALASPQNHRAYGSSDMFDLAAAYAFAISKNHPFSDGNKRLALTVAGVFLERNGFRLGAEERDAVSAMLALASGKLGAAGLARWLRAASSKIAGSSTSRSSSKSASRTLPRPRRH